MDSESPSKDVIAGGQTYPEHNQTCSHLCGAMISDRQAV